MNGAFGIATMIIAVPTGVKVFNWVFTMYGGEVRFEPPMLYALGFICTFIIGGMTGVMLAIPPIDFVVHNSLFLVAHFHNVIIPGVLFGVFAGYMFWFPKAFGFRLHSGWGIASFWFWITGFYLAFMPLYALGLMGMTRRLQSYDVPEWQPWLIAAGAGAALIAAGIGCMIMQLWTSIRDRDQLRDTTGDPWNGRSLEWSTASPPPEFNFAKLPDVRGQDAYWQIKEHARNQQTNPQIEDYDPIEMPQNSPTGVVCAFFASMLGFAMIWHIWWMLGAAIVGAYATFVVFAWRDRDERIIAPDDVARIDRASQRAAGPNEATEGAIA